MISSSKHYRKKCQYQMNFDMIWKIGISSLNRCHGNIVYQIPMRDCRVIERTIAKSNLKAIYKKRSMVWTNDGSLLL